MFAAKNSLFARPAAQSVKAAWAATGPGGVGTASPIAYTGTVPAGASCALVWVLNRTAATSAPTVAASVGSSSATLQSIILAASTGAIYDYLCCFSVLGPPSGSQTTTFTTSGATDRIAINTVYYDNVGAIGTPITSAGQAGQPSMSVASTNPNYMYASAFGYKNVNTGDTFSAYSQTQRYLAAGSASNEPLLVGDGLGNGGTLAFSATRTTTTYNWGGIIVPLIAA